MPIPSFYNSVILPISPFYCFFYYLSGWYEQFCSDINLIYEHIRTIFHFLLFRRQVTSDCAILTLIHEEINVKVRQWEAWQAKHHQWSAKILAKRDGVPFDTEALWQEMRAELEARHLEIGDW